MWTYARSSECILLFLMWTYNGGPSDIRSANSTVDIHGTTERMLLFGIPSLLIPKTFKTPFRPLYNSTERTLGLGGHPLHFKELVADLSYKYPYPLCFLMPLFAPRLLVDHFVSVL